MGAADEAYRAAVDEIERLRAAGGTELSFDRDPFRALDRIPPEIAGIEGLTRLNLDNTQVADLAPLAGLTALETLDLDNTQVTDLAPLAGLTALQGLWLNNTQVANLAPLAGLTALQTLWLNYTQVADIKPLAGLTALRTLRLRNIRVGDLAPLSGLTALQTLRLDNTRVADLTPLAGLTALQELTLNDTPVANLAPLAGLTALEKLWLDNTQVADLAPLAGHTTLQTLWLDNTQVADLAPLASLTVLQTLGLDNTQVTDLAPLAGLTALQWLRLNNTQVANLAPLASLTALQALWLDNTPVADLRPIRGMRDPRDVAEDHNGSDGLDFADTPFAKATEDTRRLAAIEDRRQRTRETLAFLKTLPPWPEPLPWEVPVEPERPPPLPDPDPGVPLVVTDAGIDLAPTGLSAVEVADPMAVVLHDELLARAEELVRFGNRDDTAGRFGERLTGLLRGGLGTLDPLRLHLLVEDLRRYHDDERMHLDPEVRRTVASTLEIGPGLTLGSPAVATFVARVAANLQARRDAAQVAAEIRLTEGIATAGITAPTLQQVATRAKDPDRDDQFTAIRPALTRNFVLESGKYAVATATGAVIGHLVTTGHPGWLAAHAADILIAARGWGAPYVAWIAPILDRAQQMVEGVRHAEAALRDRLDRRD